MLDQVYKATAVVRTIIGVSQMNYNELVGYLTKIPALFDKQ
jgi:hypothetical protein